MFFALDSGHSDQNHRSFSSNINLRALYELVGKIFAVAATASSMHTLAIDHEPLATHNKLRQFGIDAYDSLVVIFSISFLCGCAFVSISMIIISTIAQVEWMVSYALYKADTAQFDIVHEHWAYGLWSD